MVTISRSRRLDLAGDAPADARAQIRELLAAEPSASRKVYAALAHKVWSLLIERRLDDEVRDWHGLLQAVKAKVRGRDAAVAERLVALSDLLRESITLAETSPVEELARRPHAQRILKQLQRADDYLPRMRLLESLGLSTTHLSNVLSKLVANNLIERRDSGKEAEFRLTARGRQMLGASIPSAMDKLVEQITTFTPIDQEQQTHVFVGFSADARRRVSPMLATPLSTFYRTRAGGDGRHQFWAHDEGHLKDAVVSDERLYAQSR